MLTNETALYLMESLVLLSQEVSLRDFYVLEEERKSYDYTHI
ncbi:MAG: hypothetical protein Q7S59_10265 [Sulfurimonas sp.]|nr:hypothetical protein [Sulfurimonas sp.]